MEIALQLGFHSFSPEGNFSYTSKALKGNHGGACCVCHGSHGILRDCSELGFDPVTAFHMKMMGICASYGNGGVVFEEENENDKISASYCNLLKVLKRIHGDGCCLFHGFCYGSNAFLWIAVVVEFDLVTSQLKMIGICAWNGNGGAVSTN